MLEFYFNKDIDTKETDMIIDFKTFLIFIKKFLKSIIISVSFVSISLLKYSWLTMLC